MDSPYLTAKKAAEYCVFSLSYFYQLQSKGLTPAIGYGGKGRIARYTREGLDRWLKTRGKAPRK